MKENFLWQLLKHVMNSFKNIRHCLKELDGRNATKVREYFDKIKPNAKKVVIVKQIAGQGAMYDNQLFAQEPRWIMKVVYQS